jgi:hypothetical protein
LLGKWKIAATCLGRNREDPRHCNVVVNRVIARDAKRGRLFYREGLDSLENPSHPQHQPIRVASFLAEQELSALGFQVLLADSTRELAGDGFEINFWGEKTVTGRKAMTKVYELVVA